MRTSFFVDVPSKHRYDWTLSPDCAIVLQLTFGVTDVVFIVNNSAGRSTGDLYKVTLSDDDEVMSFVLRTGVYPFIPFI